jgi:hypothetical protein
MYINSETGKLLDKKNALKCWVLTANTMEEIGARL